MWAVLDYDNKTVVGVYPPDCPEEVRNADAQGRKQILMTLENSPAYVNGTYINGRFYPPKEERNLNG